MPDVGTQLVEALVDGRFDDVQGMLDEDVDFAGLVPSRLREGKGRDETMAIFRMWFDPSERPRLEEVAAGAPVQDRRHVRYRVRNVLDDVEHVFEQHAYYDVSPDERITWMRVVCSGQIPAG